MNITPRIKKSAINDPTSFIELDLHGARKFLTLKGVPLLIETKRSDGKTGSTHPCTPNFANKDNLFELPQHGPARDADWKLLDQTEDTLTITYSIEGGIWLKGLKVIQTLRITSGKFELYTVHTNTTNIGMPLIYGEHFYWSSPKGIDGLKLNGEEIESLKGYPEKFSTDGIVAPLDLKNSLEVPGLPSITLDQENLIKAVIWRGKGDSDYVCVEPVMMNPQKDENGKPYFGSEESLILGNETKSTYVSINLEG